MHDVVVRKEVVSVEEIFHENGPGARSNGLPRGWCWPCRATRSPAATSTTSQPSWTTEAARPRHGAAARGERSAASAAIEGYGKGAIVGAGGELEHGALWHAPGGYGMRELLGGAKAIVPRPRRSAVPARGSTCP